MALWTVDSTAVTTDSTVATTDGFFQSGGLAAAAADSVSAAGKLINFASVTLTAPLYTGIGGIFDPNVVWQFSTPIVGSVIRYDPTILTVLSNGETIWTTNTGSAEIQFNDGTNVNEVDLFVTPLMVGYARTSVSARGSLELPMLGAAIDLSTAIGALTTSIPLSAAANDVTSALAALSAAIRLVGVANDVTSATATLLGTSPALSGAASDSVSAAAALSTQIQLAAVAADVTAALAALTAQIRLLAAAVDAVSAQGSLGSSVSLSGVALDISLAAGRLGGLIVVAEIILKPEANRTFKLQ